MVDDLQHGAVEAEALKANSPNAISPIWASDEYVTTPRKSGERNASKESVDERDRREHEDRHAPVVGEVGNFGIAIRSRP